VPLLTRLGRGVDHVCELPRGEIEVANVTPVKSHASQLAQSRQSGNRGAGIAGENGQLGVQLELRVRVRERLREPHAKKSSAAAEKNPRAAHRSPDFTRMGENVVQVSAREWRSHARNQPTGASGGTSLRDSPGP